MSLQFSNNQRTNIKQLLRLRYVFIGTFAATLLIVLALIMFQNAKVDDAAAKKVKSIPAYDYVICPDENVESKPSIPQRISSPKKAKSHSVSVYTRLDTIIAVVDTIVNANEILLTREFTASAYDSYIISLSAHTTTANDNLQIQVRVNGIPVLRTTAENEIKIPATVIWDNIEENKAIVTVHVFSPEGYTNPVSIDGFYVVMLRKDVLLTQLFRGHTFSDRREPMIASCLSTKAF